jgi:hypothetical protein
MKKETLGERKVLFATALPYYKIDFFGDVWHRRDKNVPAQNATRQAKGGYSNNRFFEKLYMTVFEAKESDDEIRFQDGNFDMTFNNKIVDIDSHTYFHWNFDKLIKKMLYRIKKSTIDVEEVEEDYDVVNEYLTKNKWNRDSNGVYINDNGTKLYLNNEAQQDRIDALLDSSQQNCYTSHFKGDCENYMTKCVLADNQEEDLKTCIQFLKRENFSDTLKEEVNNMHPYMVFKTLKKLGFKSKIVSDDPFTNGRSIKKVQSYGEWISDIERNNKSNLDSSEIQQLKNSVLKTYLTYLTDFMNSNPKILNNDYDGPTMEKAGEQVGPTYSMGLKIPQRKEILRKDVKANESMTRLEQNLLQLKKIKLGFGKHGLSIRSSGLVPTAVPLMLGGDGGVKFMYANGMQNGGGLKFNFSDFSRKHGAYALMEIFNELKAQLKMRNKKLTEKSQQRIYNNLEKFKRLEQNVLKSLEYIRLATEILDAFKGTGKVTEDIFSEATLQKFVENNKYLTEKYQKAELDLYSILSALVKAQTGQEPDVTQRSGETVPLSLP